MVSETDGPAVISSTVEASYASFDNCQRDSQDDMVERPVERGRAPETEPRLAFSTEGIRTRRARTPGRARTSSSGTERDGAPVIQSDLHARVRC